MYGTHLLSTSEELQPIELTAIYELIKAPSDSILSTIARLRALRTINKTMYTQLKKELPFFVCGIFSPKFRRSENFAYIEYFVVDIDNLSEKNLNCQELKLQFVKDERVAMCFTSPSNDGIKLIFRLSERCYDMGMYSMFYRSFVHEFSNQYNLKQVLDSKTCDATRACFISYDPLAYFQSNPTFINLSDYLNFNNVDSIFSQDSSLINSNNEMCKRLIKSEPKVMVDPDKATLQHIKEILGQKRALLVQNKPPVYVPEILDEVIAEVKHIIEETGIIVTNITDIQYGKKIHSSLGLKTSEVNLFFGKKGFSVVQTPKRGCSSELNEIVADILKCHFQIW